jgi:predicted transcriptional regulator of viral defense system
MTMLHALSRVLAMNVPVFTTSDTARQLRVPNGNASVMLARLAASSQVIRLRRGVWAIKDRVDPLALPEYLTAPFPAYVSLHSALYLHGMISQIPAVTYAVSLARTRRYDTPLGAVSIHHVQPSFFFGFEAAGGAGSRLATPEKALVDFLYLAPARSKLFRALPEIELPRKFSVHRARSIVKRVTPMRRQKVVARKLEELLSARR